MMTLIDQCSSERICESFSEWRQFCVDSCSCQQQQQQQQQQKRLLSADDLSSGKSVGQWASVIVRMTSCWAHAATSGQAPQRGHRDEEAMMQQQTVAPLSTSPLSISTSLGDSSDSDAVVDKDHYRGKQKQGGHRARGIIVQPLMWCVVDQQSRRLLFAQPLPPDLASAETAALDIAQWHAGRIISFAVEHTPAETGMRPEKIVAASFFAASRGDEDNDFAARCDNFTAQSFETQMKLLVSRANSNGEPAADAYRLTVTAASDNRAHIDDSKITTTILVATSLQQRLAASSQLHLIPPDQSDPAFLSLLPPDAAFALHKFCSEKRFLTANPNVEMIELSAAHDASVPRFALLVPRFLAASGNNSRLLQSMSTMHLSSSSTTTTPSRGSSDDDRGGAEMRLGSIRIYRDLGDAVAARCAFQRAASSTTTTSAAPAAAAADWAEVLAPTQDSGGEIVIECWLGPEMMRASEMMAAVGASGAPYLHGFVQVPQVDSAQSEKSKQIQQRIGGSDVTSSLGLSRRQLSAQEIATVIVPWIQALSVSHADDDASVGGCEGTFALFQRRLLSDKSATACSWCGRVRLSNKKCGACRSVAYCCVAHQSLHFKKGGSHKTDCPLLNKAREEIEQCCAREAKSDEETSASLARHIGSIISLCINKYGIDRNNNSNNNNNSNSRDAQQRSVRSVLVQLPPTVETEMQLRDVAEHVVRGVTTTTAAAAAATACGGTNESLIFVTLCCSPNAPLNSTADVLRVVQRQHDAADLCWLPPATQLGDIWCEKESVGPIWRSATGGVVCRVHLFASLATIAAVPLPSSLTPSSLTGIVFAPENGLSFFEQRTVDAADFLEAQRVTNKSSSSSSNSFPSSLLLVSDSPFGAETAARVVLSKMLPQKDERADIEILVPFKDGASLIVRLPDVTSKILLPRVLHGFVARIK